MSFTSSTSGTSEAEVTPVPSDQGELMSMTSANQIELPGSQKQQLRHLSAAYRGEVAVTGHELVAARGQFSVAADTH